jgi:hypothetical protein
MHLDEAAITRYDWVCVINPSESTFESIKTLLEEAHGIAMGRGERRKIRKDGRA